VQIRLEQVSKVYRDADRELSIIKELSWEFEEHGAYAIVGRSGIGKSTLMHILGGLDRPSKGQVWIGDKQITALSDQQLTLFRGTHVGFIFQFHHLLAEFSALENVAMPLLLGGESESSALQKSAALLERVGLASRAAHLPSQLSGGEQQRVAVARALVGRPRLVLADEPTGNLDLQTAALVQTLLMELQSEMGSTLIVVTHSQDFARTMKIRLEMQPGGMLRQLS
jgi:lipoprotein-releasing system ATP-binding protein